MKKVIEVSEKGLEGLLGQRVTLLCVNFYYTGTLMGVNETCVYLEDPAIVYETGSWTEPKWKDAQALPGHIYVMTSAIEAFGVLK